MSAVCGIFRHDQQSVAPDDLERMSAALRPYGPEGGGTWIQAHVGLAQRLRRFTPEDKLERQPLLSPNGKQTLVFAGRLDNRPELAAALGLTASEAGGLPDSALALRACLQWGEPAFARLCGPFALALWDADRRQVIAARAPFTSPPLFYHATPRALAFATMRRGLWALPHVPRALDEQVLADYLARAPVEPELGFYQEIRQLPPGHILRLTLDGFRVERYWQLDLRHTLRYPTDDDYVEAFLALFARVVEAQLRCLTPAGLMLSGGLDSASVAAVAAPILAARGERLAAFTEVPRPGFDGPIVEGRYADETPYVRAIAARYANLDLNLVRTDGQMYLDNLDAFFEAAEVPFRNASNRVYWDAIQRAARDQGVHTLLTGERGNLTLSWAGGGLMPELLRTGRWLRALREARALASEGYARSTMRALIGQGVMPWLPKPLWLIGERLRQRRGPAWKIEAPWQTYSVVKAEFAREHCSHDRALSFQPGPDTRGARLKVLENAGQLFDGLEKGFQALYGLEMRQPAVDQRLVEFCLALPEDQFLRQGHPKWLIRRAMRDKLPDEVLWNMARGLQAADWFERLLGAQPAISATLDRMEASDLARRAIDLPRLRRLAQAMPQAGQDPQALMRDYRQVLEWGLMTGSFIVWFESGRPAC